MNGREDLKSKEMAKKVSMAKVARTYRKTTKPSSDLYTGKTKIKAASGRIPTQAGLRTPDYTPKPKSATFGGTRNNKGATIRKTGRA